jgi:hypothetical protein
MVQLCNGGLNLWKFLNEKRSRGGLEALKEINLWKYPLWQASLPPRTC